MMDVYVRAIFFICFLSCWIFHEVAGDTENGHALVEYRPDDRDYSEWIQFHEPLPGNLPRGNDECTSLDVRAIDEEIKPTDQPKKRNRVRNFFRRRKSSTTNENPSSEENSRSWLGFRGRKSPSDARDDKFRELLKMDASEIFDWIPNAEPYQVIVAGDFEKNKLSFNAVMHNFLAIVNDEVASNDLIKMMHLLKDGLGEKKTASNAYELEREIYYYFVEEKGKQFIELVLEEVALYFNDWTRHTKEYEKGDPKVVLNPETIKVRLTFADKILQDKVPIYPFPKVKKNIEACLKFKVAGIKAKNSVSKIERIFTFGNFLIYFLKADLPILNKLAFMAINKADKVNTRRNEKALKKKAEQDSDAGSGSGGSSKVRRRWGKKSSSEKKPKSGWLSGIGNRSKKNKSSSAPSTEPTSNV